MITLNEICYLIAERLPGQSPGLPPDAVLIRTLVPTVLYWRATLLRRDFSSNSSIPKAAKQELRVEMELVDAAEDQMVEYGCTVLRSISPVPQPIRTKDAADFSYVGGINRQFPFTYALREEVPFRLSTKYTRNQPLYAYENGYLYLYNTTAESVYVQSMFDDPRAVSLWRTDIPLEEYDGDQSFPIPEDMVQQLVQAVLATEYRVQAPTPGDTPEVSK